MEEYVTITDGAKLLGTTTKRIQRAIRAGELPARYPHPNKAEISATDLRAWHAGLYVRPSETQDRLVALEARVSELEAEVQDLRHQLESLPAAKKKALFKPDQEAPDGFIYLSDFCAQHFIPYQAAADLFPRALRGLKIKVGKYNQIILGPKGRHDFYVQLHTRSDFRSCDGCPHKENGQSV